MLTFWFLFLLGGNYVHSNVPRQLAPPPGAVLGRARARAVRQAPPPGLLPGQSPPRLDQRTPLLWEMGKRGIVVLVMTVCADPRVCCNARRCEGDEGNIRSR